MDHAKAVTLFRQFVRLLAALAMISILSAPTQPVVAGGGTIHFYVDPSAPYIPNNLCTDPAHPCRIEEVMAKVATDGAYTLHMAAGTYTYNLSASPIDYQLTMIGPDVPEGSDPVVILDGQNDHPVMVIMAPGHTITLQNLVIQNGYWGLAEHGGGILCNSMSLSYLTLDHVVVRHNYSHYDGGGIASWNCALTITNSRIEENTAEKFGAGIYADASPVSIYETVIQSNTANHPTDSIGGGIVLVNQLGMTLDRVSIANNHAAKGAGIVTGGNQSSLFITNSTISHNIAGSFGGGMYAYGNVTINNSTFSDNQAVSDPRGGGGIYGAVVSPTIKAVVNVNHATLAGNTAVAGGGSAIYLEATVDGYARMITVNSIFSGPAGVHVCRMDDESSITTYGHNLASDVYCGLENSWNGDMRPVDPQLGPLQDNGGSTFSRALLPGSPAIDQANDEAYFMPTDQRGVSRFDGNHDGIITSDIGAFEYVNWQTYIPIIRK